MHPSRFMGSAQGIICKISFKITILNHRHISLGERIKKA